MPKVCLETPVYLVLTVTLEHKDPRVLEDQPDRQEVLVHLGRMVHLVSLEPEVILETLGQLALLVTPELMEPLGLLELQEQQA